MQRNGQEETDKVEIGLTNLGTVNKNEVFIRKGSRQITLYFSYETLIAVNGLVSQNEWSKTTGKFLNELEPNHKARVSHEEVLKEAEGKTFLW